MEFDHISDYLTKTNLIRLVFTGCKFKLANHSKEMGLFKKVSQGDLLKRCFGLTCRLFFPSWKISLFRVLSTGWSDPISFLM